MSVVDEGSVFENLLRGLFKNDRIEFDSNSLMVLQGWIGDSLLELALSLIESNCLLILDFQDIELCLCLKENTPHPDSIESLLTNYADKVSAVHLFYPRRYTKGSSDFRNRICSCCQEYRNSHHRRIVSCPHELAWFIYKSNTKRLSRFVTVLHVNNAQTWVNVQDVLYNRQFKAESYV